MKTENRIYAIRTAYGNQPGWFESPTSNEFNCISGSVRGGKINPAATGFRGMSKDEIAAFEAEEELYEWDRRNKA